MPFEIHTPPWTNFHELNLDWIVKKVKELEKKVETSGYEGTTLQALVDDAIEAKNIGLSVGLWRPDSLNFEVAGDLCESQYPAWSGDYLKLFTWDSANPGRIKVLKSGFYYIRVNCELDEGDSADIRATVYGSANPVSYTIGSVTGGENKLDYLMMIENGHDVAIRISPTAGSALVQSARWTLLKVL